MCKLFKKNTSKQSTYVDTPSRYGRYGYQPTYAPEHPEIPILQSAIPSQKEIIV